MNSSLIHWIAPDIPHSLLLQKNGVTHPSPAPVLPSEPHAHIKPTTNRLFCVALLLIHRLYPSLYRHLPHGAP